MAPKPANGGANPRSPETAALLRQIAELSGAINRKKAIDAAVNEAKSRGSQPTTPRNTALSSSAGQKKPPTAFNGSIMPATTQQAKKPAASRNMKLVNGTGPNPTKTAQSSETTSKQSLGPVPPADLPKNQTNSVVQSTDLPPQWVKKRAHQLILRSALPSVGTSTLSARRRVQDTLGFSAPQLFTKKTPQKTLTLPQSPAAARLRTVTPGGRVEINGVVYKKSLRGNKFTRLGAETPRTASASAAAKTNQPRGSKKQTVMIRGLPYVRDPRKPHTLVLKSVSDAAAVAAAVGKQQKPMPKAVELNGKLYIRTVNGNLRLASKAARRKRLVVLRPIRVLCFPGSLETLSHFRGTVSAKYPSYASALFLPDLESAGAELPATTSIPLPTALSALFSFYSVHTTPAPFPTNHRNLTVSSAAISKLVAADSEKPAGSRTSSFPRRRRCAKSLRRRVGVTVGSLV